MNERPNVMGVTRAGNTEFMLDWKAQMFDVLKRVKPEASEGELVELINRKFEERFNNPMIFLHNNVKIKDIGEAQKKFSMGLLELIEVIKEHNPILTESGVMYKQHAQQTNPISDLLWKWKAERGQLKKKALQAFEAGDMATNAIYDLGQGNKKVNMNSYYGASGLKTAVMFNLYNAESVTLKGQRIISSSDTCMDAFLSNNTPFMYLEEFFTFIHRVEREEYKIDIIGLHKDCDYKPKVRDVAIKMYESFHENIQGVLSVDEIADILGRLSTETLYKLYYKNNLYAALMLDDVQTVLKTILDKLNLWNRECEDNFFIDPNKAPECVKEELDQLYHLLSDLVLYKYMAVGRVGRLKHEPRASVVTIDTDSNMINVDPFYLFVRYVIQRGDILDFDPNIFRFNVVNIISCVLTKIINDVMYKFTITSNINDHEYRLLINMKNEFLFKKFLTTEAKKNYVGLTELKEGKRPKVPKMNIMGLQIKKSSVNANVRDQLSDILEYDIMRSEDIEVPEILQKISAVEDSISESLRKGERKYCSPSKVKGARAYANPMTQTGYRGMILWNTLYEDNKIEAPGKVAMVKLNITKPADFERLKEEAPEIYDKLMSTLFDMGNQSEEAQYFQSKGITVLSLPTTDEVDIPEWTKNFICYDEIITNSTKVMLPILKSLALTTGSSTKLETFSNIIQL